MKKILTFVLILFLLKSGAQTSVTPVQCSNGKYFVRVTFTDEFIPLHNISETTCADGSVHYDTEESLFLKCYMELFADAACTIAVPVDPRFFSFGDYTAASHGTRDQPSFLYISDCSATIPPGLEHQGNWRTDHILNYTQQCIWQCSGSGYYDCYTTGPGVPTNYNIIINCCFGPSTLAVHLVNFNGQRNAGVNTLTWDLDNKQDFVRLELERSFDGVRFDVIYGSADANVISSSDVASVMAYYRLKVYNTNGTFFYSSIVVLKNGAVASEFSVSPSPFTDVLRVSVTAGRHLSTVFKLCSLDGRMVFSVSWDLKAGVNNLVFNVPDVAAGIYTLTMSNEEGAVGRKILKQ